MLINVDGARLRAFLDACEDAEALDGGEYTVDLYDVETPVSLDILIGKKGVDVLAALELLYDEEQDGWYMGDQVSDEAEILRALNDAINNNA